MTNELLLQNNIDLLLENNNKFQKEICKVKDQNKTQEQILIDQSKAFIVQDMIGAVAHQWRQPLNTIATMLINLETKAEVGKLNYEDIITTTTNINNTLQTASKTIDNFRNFFISSKIIKKVNLKYVIQNTIDLVEAQFTAHNISIEFIYDEESEYIINGNFNELRQVILNLFYNSKDAIERRIKDDNSIDGIIEIKLKEIDNNIEILVFDNGGGISNNIIKKVFRPYFTTKLDKQGTGIGLYLSKTIIEKLHNGLINVSSSNNTTYFKILFKSIN